MNNTEELFLDLQDHLETSLEILPDIEISSKSGWSTDMTTSVVKVARHAGEKKCVELKVEYPIPTRIFTNFSDFSKSNKNLVELDKEMVSMLKKVKRMGIEYGVKKYLSEGRLVYIIRGFVPQELDDKSKERIKGLDIKKRMVEYFEGLMRKSIYNFYFSTEHVFRSGKLYVGGFQIRKPEDLRSRNDYSYYFNQQETAQIIDDMLRQEKDHPQFRLSRKRGPGLGFVISLKD